MTRLLLATCLLTSTLFAADYPNKNLLVEPTDIATGFVALDSRPKAQYDAGHIRGSIWVDHAAWAKAFGDGADATGWSARIGELGLTAKSKVVVLDDNQVKDSARIWWILRYWGIADARLLNGGWKSWTSGKHDVTQEATTVTAARFEAVAQVDRLATKKFLIKTFEDGKIQIVDARSEKEFCGTEKMTNKKAGAMPGAKQLEWTDLLEPTTQRFKSADDLTKLFAESGIALDKPSATYCQSGGRASVMAFGMELMGAKNVRNYYRSWSEWGNADDTPIEPGKPKDKK